MSAAKKTAKKTATTTAPTQGDPGAFSAEEKAAMKATAAERRARAKGVKAEDDLKAVLDAIAAMPDEDREMCQRLHEIITGTAPELAARTWYGMPAYTRDGKVVVFVKNAAKFKSRYTTLGFEEAAALDSGAMWPTSYALLELTESGEKEIADLVRRAAG